MANFSRKGIWPLNRDQDSEILFIVDAANGTRLAINDVVKCVAAGAVNYSAAADANIVAGTVVALYDTNKTPLGHWNSLVSTKYLPASTAGYALVALALPGRKFIAQSDTVLTVAAIMASTDHVATACDTVTAMSNFTINGGDLNTGGQFFIVQPYDEPGNDITSANAKWIVMFNESMFMGTGKTAGV